MAEPPGWARCPTPAREGPSRRVLSRLPFLPRYSSVSLTFAPLLVFVGILLLVCLPARLLNTSSGAAEEWVTGVDLPLAFASGGGGAALASLWLVPRVHEGYPVWGSSFAQYCALVGGEAWGMDVSWFSGPRSAAAAWPAARLVPVLGTMDALVVYGIIGWVLSCTGLFLWARVVLGRSAGIAAVAIAGLVPAVLYSARDISFYPVANAASVLLAAAVAALFRFRGPWPALGAGLAGSALLLADARGLLLGLALLAPATVAAILRAQSRPLAALRLALVLVPVVGSWFLAAQVQAPGMSGVVAQAYAFYGDTANAAGVAPWWLDGLAGEGAEAGVDRSGCELLWGRTRPAEVQCALKRLRVLGEGMPAAVRRYPASVEFREKNVHPWIAPGLLSLAGAALALRRRPWQILALLVTGAPFLAMLVNSAQLLPHPRFLSGHSLVIPVLLGVGLASFMERSLPTSAAPGPARWRWHLLSLGSALAAVVVLGGPTYLRRVAVLGDGEPQETLRPVLAGQADPRNPCTGLLLDEAERGFRVETTVYGTERLLARP